MRLTSNSCLPGFAAFVFVAIQAEYPVFGQEIPKEKMDGATLVIVASVSGGRLKNEFIVLQFSKSKIKWTATASTKDRPVEGVLDVSGVRPDQVFERVNRLAKKETQGKNTFATELFSLMLIDAKGVKTCGLDRVQRLELGKKDSLGPVLDSIVKHRVYARANPMLEIVIPDYEPTQVTSSSVKFSNLPEKEEVPPRSKKR